MVQQILIVFVLNIFQDCIIPKFIGDKNMKRNSFRKPTYSIMCPYGFIKLINFMFNNKN